jgi:hypothetical protein
MGSCKVVLKSISGAFVVGETVVGNTSLATATVSQVGDTFIVLAVKSRRSFDLQETITGSTATGEVFEIVDNTLRTASRMQDNLSTELSTGIEFEYLKNHLNHGIPTKTSANRRLIAQKIKDMYISKSTEEAYRLFFKALFDEEVQFRFPGDEILRVSDGVFEQTIIARARTTFVNAEMVTVVVDPFSFLNTTVRGLTSNAVGNIVNVRRTFLEGFEVAEFTMTLVAGTFLADEYIFSVDTPALTTTLFGLVTGFTITDAGSGYSVGDTIPIISSGVGGSATATVSSISSGEISSISVGAIGYGYRLGINAVVDNTSTGGSRFAVRVTKLKNTYNIVDGGITYTVGEIETASIVNRGEDYFKAPTIALVDTTIEALGLLHEGLVTITSGGTGYDVGDALVVSAGSATAIVASITPDAGTQEFAFEDGFNLALEDGSGILTIDDPAAVSVDGEISRIDFTDYGTGYGTSNLPTISAPTGNTDATFTVTGVQGASANISVDVAGNNIGLGAIRAIDIANFGVSYTQGTTTVDASGIGDGNAVLAPIVTGVGVSAGQFLTTDSLIGQRIIQDSFFYQDFSYVLRSGLSSNQYRPLIKEALHPAGTEFFGEILISSFISVTPRFYTVVNAIDSNRQISYQLNVSVPVIIPVPARSTVVHIALPIDVATTSYEAVRDPVDYIYQPLSLYLKELCALESFKTDTFLDVAATRTIDTLVRLEGLFTTNGTTTITGNVDVDFARNLVLETPQPVIIGDEKLIITSIVDANTITVDRIPSNTTVDQPAYREKYSPLC